MGLNVGEPCFGSTGVIPQPHRKPMLNKACVVFRCCFNIPILDLMFMYWTTTIVNSCMNNFRKTNANVLRSKIQIFVPIKLFFHTIGLSNNEQRSNEKSAQCETGLVADSRMALHFRFIELAFDSIH
uniref:SFRICE_010068 n=1 Tax=Spodoptera frugiperda TaxID=7108 RepID=A0A2H1VV41_SPOFR